MFNVYKNNNFKIKLEINGKINLQTDCIDCGSKKFETIDEKKFSSLLRA